MGSQIVVDIEEHIEGRPESECELVGDSSEREEPRHGSRDRAESRRASSGVRLNTPRQWVA